MILCIIFAHVWGTLQLIVLGSLARTVRMRTAFTALIAGFYACAVFAVLLEVAWSRPVAWVTRAPLPQIVEIGSYTADPLIEELVKVLPLAMLMLLPVIRRQWSVTDYVIVGGALGSGFGLAEDLYRYSAAAGNSVWTGESWLIRPNLATVVTVPGPFVTVTSWLPAGATSRSLFSLPGRSATLNMHTALSAIAGLAVAFLVLGPGSRQRRGAIVLLLYVALDHALFNASLRPDSSTITAVSSSVMQALLPFLALAAMVAAWWTDYQRMALARAPDLALAAEMKTHPPAFGTIQAALSHLPWSLASVDTFVRMRRVYALTGASENALRRALLDLREQIDGAGPHSDSMPTHFSEWARAQCVSRLRQPKVISSLAIMIPAVLWFSFGSGAMGSEHGAVTNRLAWAAIRVLCAASLALIAWNVIISVGQWPQSARRLLSDIPAMLALRIGSGAGAFALGVYVLLAALDRQSPYGNLINNSHVIDALGKLSIGHGLALPPFALLAWSPGSQLGGVDEHAPEQTDGDVHQPEPQQGDSNQGEPQHVDTDQPTPEHPGADYQQSPPEDHKSKVKHAAANASVALNNAAVVFGSAGVISATVGVVSGVGALAGVGVGAVFALGSFASWGVGNAYQRLANDPPRWDFDQVETFQSPPLTPWRAATLTDSAWLLFVRRSLFAAAAIRAFVINLERWDGLRLKQQATILDPNSLSRKQLAVYQSRQFASLVANANTAATLIEELASSREEVNLAWEAVMQSRSGQRTIVSPPELALDQVWGEASRILRQLGIPDDIAGNRQRIAKAVLPLGEIEFPAQPLNEEWSHSQWQLAQILRAFTHSLNEP